MYSHCLSSAENTQAALKQEGKDPLTLYAVQVVNLKFFVVLQFYFTPPTLPCRISTTVA